MIDVVFKAGYENGYEKARKDANDEIKELRKLLANVEKEAQKWEKLAHEWCDDYTKLKDKYEPMVAVIE